MYLVPGVYSSSSLPSFLPSFHLLTESPSVSQPQSPCRRVFSTLSSSDLSIFRCSLVYYRRRCRMRRLVISGSRCLPCTPRPCPLLIQLVRILILTHRREPEVAFVAPQPISPSLRRRQGGMLPRLVAVPSVEAAARRNSRRSQARTSGPAVLRSCFRRSLAYTSGPAGK